MIEFSRLAGSRWDINNVWEWDGTTWTRKAPAIGPAPRYQNAVVYDAARQAVVAIGGVGRGASSYLLLADVWEWDGKIWTDRSPPPAPHPRASSAVAFDDARGRVVLYGGFVNGNLADTWEWNGLSWDMRQPQHSPPPVRYHALAYDSERKCVVLFGGRAGAPSATEKVIAETWEWNGSDWVQRNPVSSPSARQEHALAYDAARRWVVLFGGYDTKVPLSDTWTWDGTNWTELKATSTPPCGIATYDGLRQHVVLVAMGGGDTRTDPWLLTAATRARFVTTGTGCGGASGVPRIAAFGRPWIGNASFGIDLLSLRAFSPAMLVVGSHTCSVPLGGGCTLYVDPGSWIMNPVALANASGFAHLPMAIPAERRLLGMKLYAQAAAYDPGAPLKDVALSARLELTIGE
ncbi:MAG: hypothetical protein JXQ29_13815 [Planctomycetes bacterium]|nr:hypothetical protein [Planctomycetota bacterium]